MLEVKDSTQLSSTSNDPRFQPAEWVVDAVKRDLCKPEEPWIRHPIACLPGLISEMVGAFDRSKIQHFYSQLERVRTNAKKVKDEGIRNGALEDLDALESAGKVLRRLLEKEEQARPQTDLFQPAPVPPTPSSGVGDQHQPSPPTHVEEAEGPSQPEPTPPPPAPLSPAPEPSLPAPCFPRVDLMDPRHIASAHEFVKAVTSARQHLWQLSDEQEIRKVANYAQLLEALAKTIELGAEFEMEGKALKFEAYYRAYELRGPVLPGPAKKGSHPPRVLKEFESKTARNNLALVGKFDRNEFESLLQQGVESKTLSEKTFRTRLSGSPGQQLSCAQDSSKNQSSRDAGDSKSGQRQAKEPDLLAQLTHLLNGLGADFRLNSWWYLDHVEELAYQPLLVENWGPVAEKAKAFFDRFLTALIQSRKTSNSEVSSSSDQSLETTLSI